MTAIRHLQTFKNTFGRLVSRHGIKMKAAVAIQRKLLELMFTLYKTQTKFDKEILNKGTQKEPITSEKLGGEHGS